MPVRPPCWRRKRRSSTPTSAWSAATTKPTPSPWSRSWACPPSRATRSRVKATGPDADKAIAALASLIADGCGEKPGEAPQPAADSRWQPARAVADRRQRDRRRPGLPRSRRRPIFQYRHDVVDVDRKGGAAATSAASSTPPWPRPARQIEELKGQHARPLQGEDPRRPQGTARRPRPGRSGARRHRRRLQRRAIPGAKPSPATPAVWKASTIPCCANAATDIRDVGRRVLALLAGIKQEQIEVPQDAILVAEDLAPSDIASIDRTRVLGFCTTSGGATSHVAIIARSFGIPADLRHRRVRPAPRQRRPGRARRRHAACSAATRTKPKSPGPMSRSPDQAERRREEAGDRDAAGADHATATASKSSPTSATPTTPARPSPPAARASACCAPSSCSTSAIRPPSEDEQARCLRRRRRGARPRPSADHPHPRCRRRQAAVLPAAARRRKTPSSACAASASASTSPEMFRTQLRAILRAAPPGRPAHHVPDDRDAGGTARRQAHPGGGTGRDRCRPAPRQRQGRHHGRSALRRRPWPTSSRREATSSRSAPTT